MEYIRFLSIFVFLLASTGIAENFILGVNYSSSQYTVNCNGSEYSLLECETSLLTSLNCTSNRIAAVVCEGSCYTTEFKL